jgi:hypothetical protein
MTLEQVHDLFRLCHLPWGLTRTAHLVKAIRAAAPDTLAVPDKLIRVRRGVPLPAVAICKFWWPGLWKSHFVVWADFRFWDPEEDGTCGGRMTAYLPVRRKNG